MSSNDPGAFLRDLMSGWEKMAGTAAPGSAGMVAAMQQMTERALAAANLATHSDLADLAARVTAIEATLARIEAKLDVAASTPEKPGKRAQGREGRRVIARHSL